VAQEVWTPIKILQWAVPYLSQKGIKTARLDAECLIAQTLGVDRLRVYLQFDRPLSSSELDRLRDFMKRRALREPLQYILGSREFFGHSFKVNSGVLIPRPETEHVVETALKYLRSKGWNYPKILDLGTGTGCIAISIAKNYPVEVWGVDLSEKALEMAIYNAQTIHPEGVYHWRQGNCFQALLPSDPKSFQVILSNPPYLLENEIDELDDEIKLFEPKEALFAGKDGMDVYREIAGNLFQKLAPDGVGILELHSNNVDKIMEVFRTPKCHYRSSRVAKGFESRKPIFH
jgi:release factor glutamine methyltransferase